MSETSIEEPRRRTISLPDGEMAALEFGDPNRPVDLVFLHANGFNALTYRSILAPLADRMHILAVDQRGHGSSRLPAQPRGLRSWRVYRDDLLALLQTLEGPPLILAGHSMGATACILAAGAQPGVTPGLVLFEPVILPRLMALYAQAPWTSGRMWKTMPMALAAARRRSVFESLEAAFAAYKGRGAFKTWSDAMLTDYVAAGFVARAEGGVELACSPAWEAANFAAQGHDPWTALKHIKVPVRLLRAERHSTARIEPVARFMRRYPHVQVQTVTGTSHFLPMERPEVVQAALLGARG